VKIVSVMGDGSFGFTVGELETVCRLKIPLAMVVISNSSYGWIKAGQKSGFGERYFSVDFSRTGPRRRGGRLLAQELQGWRTRRNWARRLSWRWRNEPCWWTCCASRWSRRGRR